MGMLTFLTTVQAAELFHQSPRTLERWRWLRIGPAWHTFGGSVRYELTDLATWIEAQRHDPGQIRRDLGLED